MRNQIANLISSIQPFDILEADHIRETQEWINSGCEIFRRESPDVPPKHLNTYFFV